MRWEFRSQMSNSKRQMLVAQKELSTWDRTKDIAQMSFHPITSYYYIITTLLLHHISFHIHGPGGPKFLCAQGGFARGSVSWASETACLYS